MVVMLVTNNGSNLIDIIKSNFFKDLNNMSHAELFLFVRFGKWSKTIKQIIQQKHFNLSEN